jgi:UDP-2-acetamido-2-deoxy-ribo-hexuluronate aminotransferase
VQDCYSFYPQPGGLPVSEAKAKTVLSLPMHPYLDEAVQGKIIDGVRSFNG